MADKDVFVRSMSGLTIISCKSRRLEGGFGFEGDVTLEEEDDEGRIEFVLNI